MNKLQPPSRTAANRTTIGTPAMTGIQEHDRKRIQAKGAQRNYDGYRLHPPG